MKILTDSSALAKRYVLEEGSDKVDQFLQNASQLGVCTILIPEIISALNRRRREHVLSADDYRIIKKQLMEDVHDAVVLQITPAVISRSVNLLETNALRAMDAMHIACALEWQADIFVTADRRQYQAAKNAGLLSEFIGQQLFSVDTSAPLP
jgi:predicted nucleic acid-binding protein